jgi:hypothetical protein
VSYSARGKTKILTLPPSLVPAVRAALRRYRQGVRRLERQADAGLRALNRQLRQRRFLR